MTWWCSIESAHGLLMDIHDRISLKDDFLQQQGPSAHKETVDNETEEKKRKDDDSDEEAPDRSQTKFFMLREEV